MRRRILAVGLLSYKVMRKLAKRRVSKSVLVFFMAIELVGLYAYWMHTRPVGERAFLIKSGERYLLAWKDSYQVAGMQFFDSTEAALTFARTTLELSPKAQATDDNIEAIWVRKDFNRTILYWKTSNVEFVNRLTFRDQKDAQFFENAFRRGAYVTSPIGHSINFMPISAK